MSEWYLGQDVEDLFSPLVSTYIDASNKLTENFAESLETRFETVVKETVGMAMGFVGSEPYYCGFHYSERKDEENPNGVPAFAFYFGDDYQDIRLVEDIFNDCEISELDKIITILNTVRERK